MSGRLSLHVLWMPLLSLLFQSGEARAFEQPYKVPPEELWRSDIPRAAIRFADMNGGVCLMVVVDAQGAVESVKILDGPRPVLKKAAAAERQLHFKPFLRNGRPVRATFEQCVEVIPEERWGQRQPFPTVRNWKTVKISFERRHRCDEPRCLDYKMEISGDGIVRFTRTRWASLNPMQRTAHLSLPDVRRLIEEFEQASFFSMLDRYVYPLTDGTGTTLTVSFDGQSKTVHEYAGLAAGSPTALIQLEKAVMQVAGANGWLERRDPESDPPPGKGK